MLKQIAGAIPADYGENIIVIGSLAAGVRFADAIEPREQLAR